MKKAIFVIIFGLLLSGNAYAECIEGNCINGYGTFVEANGDKYVGEFRNSIFHGQGTYTSESGFIVKYVGEYKYGFRDGQGTSTNKFGGTENGIWNNNVFVTLTNCKGSNSSKWTNCQGTFTYANGEDLARDPSNR